VCTDFKMLNEGKVKVPIIFFGTVGFSPRRDVLELGVRWYTVVYILDVYIECLPRVS
jgi:hypothetical protein